MGNIAVFFGCRTHFDNWANDQGDGNRAETGHSIQELVNQGIEGDEIELIICALYAL